MFVYTFKSSKLRWILLVVLCVLVVGAFLLYSKTPKPAASDGAVSLRASNSAERLTFISQFGWEVSDDPKEVREIIIPTQFDSVYEKYNAIQKAQDLDLSLYCGKRAKRWTYAVLNYPGYESNPEAVEINLLVYDGLVIGGDVCSLEINGFMHGFDFPTESPTEAVTT